MKALKQLAESIMFTGIKSSQMLESFDYRKGKTIEDVKKSIQKGLKNNLGVV